MALCLREFAVAEDATMVAEFGVLIHYCTRADGHDGPCYCATCAVYDEGTCTTSNTVRE